MTTEVFDPALVTRSATTRRPEKRTLSQGRLVRLPSRPYLKVKFLVEWLIAAMLFLLCLPIIAFFALAIKLTSFGPAFYAQTRLGKNGATYRMYKLRTMVHNAEAHTGPVWAARSDSRITSIGKILRDTHLDELPQLWNILRGEMGLIGPRPERPEIAARIATQIAGFEDRLQVRPGVTGLAQMLLPADDPNDTELHGLRKKLAYDLYYIGHMNLGMDVRIAIATPCYFIAAAFDTIRRKMLNCCGKGADRVHEEYDSEQVYEEVA